MTRSIAQTSPKGQPHRPLAALTDERAYDEKRPRAGTRTPPDLHTDVRADARAALDEFRESVLTGGTLGAIGYVVRGLRELPGRESVVVFFLQLVVADELAKGSRATATQWLDFEIVK